MLRRTLSQPRPMRSPRLMLSLIGIPARIHGLSQSTARKMLPSPFRRTLSQPRSMRSPRLMLSLPARIHGLSQFDSPKDVTVTADAGSRDGGKISPVALDARASSEIPTPADLPLALLGLLLSFALLLQRRAGRR